MAPFDNFYGPGGFDPTTNWGQNVLETTMQKFGGQAGGQQAPPAYVPKIDHPPQTTLGSPIRVSGGDSLGNGSSWLNYGEPPQHYVAPPSNERSASQYLMDLQNEQEAAYLRDNPPPVTVASLGGSPLADPGFQVTGTNPATAGMAGPAYVAPGAVTGANLSPTTFENLETMNEGGPSNYPQTNWHSPQYPPPQSGWTGAYYPPTQFDETPDWLEQFLGQLWGQSTPMFQLGSAVNPHPRERGYATWQSSPRIKTPDWLQHFLGQQLFLSPDRRTPKYMGNMKRIGKSYAHVF